MKNKIFSISFLILLIIIFWFRISDTIIKISPTYDEPVHIIQGYTYLKTNSMNIIKSDDQPILAKIISAIPLLFLNPNLAVFTSHSYFLNRQRYSFANLMLYYNNHDTEEIMNLGRKSIATISVLFGICLFFLIYKKFGKESAMLSAILYFFNISILAHSCLATQDFLCSVLYFLSIYTFSNFTKTKSLKYNILCSTITGALMVTKYSVVVLIFTFIIFLLYFFYIKKLKLKDITLFLCFQLIGIFLIGVIVYRHHIPELFKGLFSLLSIVLEGRSTFFFGKYSTVGFKLYFPVLFLVKTEIPLLLLFLISLILNLYKILKDKFTEEFIFILSIFIYLVVTSLSKMQIGHRHILPIYPLMLYLICISFNNFDKIKILYYILTCWLVFLSFSVHPWYLSYFNEFIGGSRNAWKYFTDSNIDWGQGLKELGKWVRENNVNGIYLSYFGTADPHYYHIKYRPIGIISNLQNNERIGDDITEEGYDRVIIAVSVTNLQSTYYKDKTVFNFLKKIDPIFIAADSIFVYDITNNIETLHEFIKLLEKLEYNEDVMYITKNFLNKRG